ncbi:hypothetical protein O181_046919 [Austropuccinia psidii MF-1]|uniref:Uncharacterized protein n=1 Tax=Austropuccinia psidii MF-1 TaxID=1389203 RepID=A0A9Q3HLN0_9BASI|nr:hypothetical protein [Austropuccinia psidii MF-1]
MPQPMPQAPRISEQLNQLPTSSPESVSEISDMVISNELGIELEILAHENNQDPPVIPESFILSQPSSSQKTDLKSYEKKITVEPCAPTEDVGQDEVISSGKFEIISKKPFSSKIS